MKKRYLALVNDQFVLNEEVKNYFQKRNIEIEEYFKSLGILKLAAQSDIDVRNLQYVTHIEEDREFRALDESE